MRIAAILIGVAGLMVLAGCGGTDEQAVVGVRMVDVGGMRTAELIADDDHEQLSMDAQMAREEMKKIPHGPGDPIYTPPAGLAAGSPLAVTTSGATRQRSWPTQVATYTDGRVGHMPRWFEDPYDNVTQPRPGVFGWSADDLIGAAYSPARFLVNGVALPASVIVHPLWEKASTDQTAAFDGVRVVDPSE